MKLLLVEDEKAIAERIIASFEQSGYIVLWTDTCMEAHECIQVEEPDCIILDRRLPDSDGLELCKKIRAEGNATPVLMLSAMSELDQRIEGIEYGADDYLVKPFSMEELKVRVQALIRRNSVKKTPNITIRHVSLKPNERQVYVCGAGVPLSQKEFMLLEYMMRNAGRALDRFQILENVWGESMSDETNIVDVYINYLRNKIDLEEESTSNIQTIRGYGYKFRREE